MAPKIPLLATLMLLAAVVNIEALPLMKGAQLDPGNEKFLLDLKRFLMNNVVEEEFLLGKIFPPQRSYEWASQPLQQNRRSYDATGNAKSMDEKRYVSLQHIFKRKFQDGEEVV